MKKTLATLMFALPLLCTSGCDSDQTSSVTADAKKSAIEEYQAMIKADEAAMNAAPPPDLKVAPAKAAVPAKATGKASAPAKATAPGKAAATTEATAPGKPAAKIEAAAPGKSAAPEKAAAPPKTE